MMASAMKLTIVVPVLSLAACASKPAPEPARDPSQITAERIATLNTRATKELGCAESDLTITPVTLESLAGASVPVLADAAGCNKTQRYRYSWGDMSWHATYPEDEGLVPMRK
jgi:hypothetical protein